MNIPIELREILTHIVIEGGKPNIVGGAVRDHLMGVEPKDFDVEVFGLDPELLKSILAQYGPINEVGASFNVIKIGNFDFSLPRCDNKNGRGHKGFAVQVDPYMSYAAAAARRDFTINSVAWSFAEEKLVDDWGGADDIRSRVLRPTSAAFKEDSLRVLRGMQFAGRFDMRASQWTEDYAEEMKAEFHDLPKERIWIEWEKWAGKSIKPSAGLVFLSDVNWLGFFSALDNIDGCPQDPVWHPEGDVFVHTCHVVDAMAKLCDEHSISGDDRVVLIFAALLHDVGKPETTVLNDEGRWSSPSHDKVGMPIARKFLESIGCHESLIERIVPLVGEHMVHVGLEQVTKRVVNRLAHRLGKATIDELLLVILADMNGRPPLEGGIPPICEDIVKMAEECKVLAEKPKPILMGRHLIEMGYKPGPAFGRVLDLAYEAQLDDKFTSLEGAMRWMEINSLS